MDLQAQDPWLGSFTKNTMRTYLRRSRMEEA